MRMLRTELERLDAAVIAGRNYSYDQRIWRQMLDVLDAGDALGIAIADAGYTWTPEMRAAYERMSGADNG
jgi:hypothetical protein